MSFERECSDSSVTIPLEQTFRQLEMSTIGAPSDPGGDIL